MIRYTSLQTLPDDLRGNVKAALEAQFNRVPRATWQQITDQVNSFFNDVWKEHGSTLDLTREYVRDTYRRPFRSKGANPPQVDVTKFFSEDTDDPIAAAARREERLKDENRQLRAALQRARRDDDSAEKIREKVYELSGTAPQPPEWMHEVTKGGTPGVPITIWSDWHWGEVVNSVEVGGVNAFNTPIGIARAKDLTESIIDLSFSHMVNPSYPGIVVGLAGDMITGDIHEELRDTNDRYTFQTILELQDHCAANITLLADHFGRVFVPCVVGNHGRDTIKPRMKGRVYTSFEWHLYNQLERFFRNDPRVQFMVPGEADAQFRVYNHRFNMTHGDSLGVKGGDGIIGSLGPIMRGAIKVGRSEAQLGREFDTLIMGHWHQQIALRGVQVNGTLKGYDEYARLGLRAQYEQPTQTLFFVHAKHGVTVQWPIYLDENKKTVSREPWVSWPEATG